MDTILVTGATGFLGYHVTKALNAAGIRPRVLELRSGDTAILDRLDVTRCAGILDDDSAIKAACEGADTLLHLAFKVGVGGADVEEMRRVNIEGTDRLLRTAAESGVRRAVAAGSALAVGVNRQPIPLDESAGAEHAFDLPYAAIRLQVEKQALALSTPAFAVVSVCPSFTFGPDDPTGAPANGLLKSIVTRKLPITLDVGFGCLDVRDFADGMIRAASRGRAGERYILSGENVTAGQLLAIAAELSGVRPPWFQPPRPLLHLLVGVLQIVGRIRGKPAPLTRDVLNIIGRFAWYDSSKARTELGWTPRPLRDTLRDTIEWLRSQGA